MLLRLRGCYRSRERRLTMIDVSNRAHVHVRLSALELLLTHLADPLFGVRFHLS